MNTTTTATSDEAISQLNSFLRGEISAVETYKMAIEKMTGFGNQLKLQDCLQSHKDRVTKIRLRISQLGGKAVESSGVWGTFAQLVQGSAELFGEKSAISALESGEDHGLAQYRDVKELDPTVRQFLTNELMPAQVMTHGVMSSLKHLIN